MTFSVAYCPKMLPTAAASRMSACETKQRMAQRIGDSLEMPSATERVDAYTRSPFPSK
jgi:hypothetical protein